MFNTTGWIPGNESCEGKIELPTEGDISEFNPLNPLSSNTDGDGLVDALEISWLESLVHDVDYSIYYEVDKDPMTKTNPCHVDTDFDGISDSEEDVNHNGRLDYGETNASHPDTDGDHLLDGPNQDKNGTNDWLDEDFDIFIFDPDNYPDWDYSSSTWAEFDEPDTYYYIGEANVKTKATMPDTDGDGLFDGDNITAKDVKGELVIHFWKNDQDMQLPEPLASSFPIAAAVINQIEPTDPNDDDTDDDELTDYMEVWGWDVTIVYGKDQKTHSERWVMSDPLVKDTDGDSVSDYYEFMNFSDPVRIDTDGDKIVDNQELIGNLTQIEGQNPEVVGEIEANVVITWTGPVPTSMKVTVTVTFRDNAGLSLVGIKITDKSWKTLSLGGGITKYKYTAEFGADYWKLLTSGWDIDVKCIDVNGNGVTGSSQLDGILEGIIKVVLAFLISLWEAVKELASKIFTWVTEFIKSLVMKAIEPILEAIQRFIDATIECILTLFGFSDQPPESHTMFLSINVSSSQEWDTEGFTDAMGFVWGGVVLIYVVMTAVMALLSAFSIGFGQLANLIISAALGFILEGVLNYAFGHGIHGFLEDFAGKFESTALAATDIWFGIFGLLGSLTLMLSGILDKDKPEDWKELKGLWLGICSLLLSGVSLFATSWISGFVDNDLFMILLSFGLATASLFMSIGGLWMTVKAKSTTDVSKAPLFWWEEITAGLAFMIALTGWAASLGDLLNYYGINGQAIRDFINYTICESE